MLGGMQNVNIVAEQGSTFLINGVMVMQKQGYSSLHFMNTLD
jgi:hypothetical protein